ncbi:amidohydrolase family protein [Aliiglaciecola sp. CAU 1673]|uniref:amidohydrolase family protein n=1 Tax=Aliiglaciecola sp. CAU 1673 TaxID=3032595 RepID=UPI0023D9EAB3|nr:amidohydrolase family protein [Aliiglaciecola sp. CAU 1673]MDF2176769.1 amidohydrolase family protein [Aliiglaciecola sp. CAU 1673]
MHQPLPIKLDSTSNGEFCPIPLSPRECQVNQQASEEIVRLSHYLGQDRRQFLISSCAAAATLLCANQVNAAHGLNGGFFALHQDAAVEPAAAAVLEGEEFIFDIQGHFVDPNGRWLNQVPADAKPFSGMPYADCPLADLPGDRSYLQCLGPKQFVKDVFMDSDTSMMVLSFVPSHREREPLTIEEADATRRIVDELEGEHRLLLHGRVNPNQTGDLEGMDELAEKWKVSAWKTYTQWGPDGKGFYLHDEKVGIPFIEKARQLGIKNICIHKGIPFGRESYEHSLCTDIGIVAKRYPDVNFIIYHSGFEPGLEEQSFAPGKGRAGIDSLVQSIRDNEVQTNSNVYAELGSTWRFLMRHPEQAAHALGKLLQAVGEDNVLWGTDSIWYGSPQDQIQAFRAFQISEAFQEQYGYPALSTSLKTKILGLNACKPYQVSPEEVARHTSKDKVALHKAELQEKTSPHFQTYGPKTRREFLNLLRWQSG